MITETEGDLLAARVQALVNPVNTVGVMGKGLALQFRRAYPAMFKSYLQALQQRTLRIGTVQVWPTGRTSPPLWIINVPTKQHWRQPSRLAYVQSGLAALVEAVNQHAISSIAVPALGCGNGGLPWEQVRQLIAQTFANLPDLDVRLYRPGVTDISQDGRLDLA